MSQSDMPIQLDAPVNGKPHPGHPATEEDFVAWCDEDTWAEWVDGEIITMAPVSLEHDDLCGWLHNVLRLFVQHQELGVVCGPEYQVRLSPDCRRIPDLLFVSAGRRGILRRNHVEGAPDLIIEIVSPDSAARDWREKYLEYQAAGVREYWIIDPDHERLEAYRLSGEGTYQIIEEKNGQVTSGILSGLYLRPAWLWQEELPKAIDVLRELKVLD